MPAFARGADWKVDNNKGCRLGTYDAMLKK